LFSVGINVECDTTIYKKNKIDGLLLGETVGWLVGRLEGSPLGETVGKRVGFKVGNREGFPIFVLLSLLYISM
jgi:hypothetical protein